MQLAAAGGIVMIKAAGAIQPIQHVMLQRTGMEKTALGMQAVGVVIATRMGAGNIGRIKLHVRLLLEGLAANGSGTRAKI